MRLNGKRAVVTGAGAGIGREIAHVFTAEGAEIVAVDWNQDGNRETTRQIEAAGGKCSAIEADVSSSEDVARVFAQAGPVDIVINNAASSRGDGLLHELSDETWDSLLAICLKSVFLCTREALKSMMPRRSGSIVNISSVNGLLGIHLAAYSAAKGGIISLTRVAAVQYARFGIRVNAICPGTILSESSEQYYREHPEIAADLRGMYPAGEFGAVGDVAACALFLASQDANFINGAIIPVDGALTAVRQLPSIVPQDNRQ